MRKRAGRRVRTVARADLVFDRARAAIDARLIASDLIGNHSTANVINRNQKSGRPALFGTESVAPEDALPGNGLITACPADGGREGRVLQDLQMMGLQRGVCSRICAESLASEALDIRIWLHRIGSFGQLR
jgi:hypothetical protein